MIKERKGKSAILMIAIVAISVTVSMVGVSGQPAQPVLVRGDVLYETTGTRVPDGWLVNLEDTTAAVYLGNDTTVNIHPAVPIYDIKVDQSLIIEGHELKAWVSNGDWYGEVTYTVQSGDNNSAVSLMMPDINVSEEVGPEPPTIVSYTITNRTIIPPQTTEIDVAFSERVEAWIKIEDMNRSLVKELYHSTGVTNPDPKTWDGTNTTDIQVPDGDYYVNVTGTNTTTELSVVNNTEIITVTTVPPVDTLPPVTTYTVTPEPNAEGWNNVIPVNVTFFRTDLGDNPSGVNHTNYSTSETGPWTKVEGNESFIVPIDTVGETTIWYYSVDKNATPLQETTKNLTVRIDTIPPGTVGDLGETDASWTWIQWNWTDPVDPGSSGVDYVEVWLDGSLKENTTEDSYRAIKLVPNTTYNISVRAVDVAGNIGAWQNDPADTLVDEEAPVINSVELDVNETIEGLPITVTVNATDNAGVTSVTAEGETLTQQGGGDIWIGTIIAEVGTNVIVNVTAMDGSGYVAYDNTTTYNATADEEAPTYTWIERPTSGTTGEPAFVNISAIDNVAVTVYNITIDGVEHVMTKNGDYYTYAINVPSGSTAAIVYNCTFGDAKGNANTTADTSITVTDNDDPVYEWVLRPDAGTTGEAVLVNVSATDNIDVTRNNITVDGDESAMTKNGDYYTYTINIPSGSTAAIVYSCTFGDEAGNTNTTPDITITVTDNDDPVINSVSLSSKDVTAGASITVTVEATDNVGVQNVTADSVSLSLTSGTWTGTITAASTSGSHTVTVIASDAAGKSATDTSQSYSVSIGGGRGGGGGPALDTDGDGYSDIVEWLQGSDPEDPCDPDPNCAACLATKPAATTPTPTPATPKPTVAVPTPVTPTAKPTAATPTPTPEEPGFGAVFAIAGLLAVAYLVLRRKK